MTVGRFDKRTVRDVDLKGKRVLLRADYNVPLSDGRVVEDYRLKASLPTLEYILKQKPAALIIISHLGRPDGQVLKEFSLKPVAERLGRLLGQSVRFAPDCVSEFTATLAAKLPLGGVMLFENLRFHPEEATNQTRFAKAIIEAAKADVFIQDGFGVVHREHASTQALAKLLPSAAGLLLEREVITINRLMSRPEHPLVAVIGGAKITDKEAILKQFVKTADVLAIGGAMANNFLAAEGHPIGGSLHDSRSMGLTREILKLAHDRQRQQAFELLLPVDVVVSTNIGGLRPTRLVDLASRSLADIEAYPKLPPKSSHTVGSKEVILDIGPISAAYICGAISLAKTVIWNGTLGRTEARGLAGAAPPFSHATDMIIEAMTGRSHSRAKPYSFVGGGDTAGYVEAQGLASAFSFVSTGGGASLDLMSGKPLPGLDALPDE